MRFLLAAIAILSLVACSEQTAYVTHHYPAQKVTPPETFMAGAATVDITPPPKSLPRAGYATWSTLGDGFRTRLYARTYYLRDQEGDSHLFVQTDLATGSRILQTKLGELLSKHTDLDSSRITITATHTHSGPGQIVGSQFYNKHISHKQGFAADYFDFLIEKISGAAMEAYNTQAPAKIATGEIPVWGLTRNRSIDPYVLNETVENKSTADSQTFHNVNPMLKVVRIDTLQGTDEYQPLGAFGSFSIHGTALPERETLFNADVWAYIHKDWEWFVEENYDVANPVHISAFEGTHGDVAPGNRFGMLGYIEARRLGKGIAQKAIALYQALDDQLTDEVDITSAMRYVNLREENTIDDVVLCKDASAGMTLAGAPLEHTSPIIGNLPFFRAGSRTWSENEDDCQGRKLHLGFKYLQPLMEPKDSFPDFVNFQVIQINDLAVVPLPFEITTETGYRIEQALRDAYTQNDKTIENVMITSLANGFTGYATTPEEYGYQNYEGGHTIYGKHTQPYLKAHVAKLANDMLRAENRVVDFPEKIEYNFVSRDFLPEKTAATGEREVVAKPIYHHAKINTEGAWYFDWRDVNNSLIEMNQPLVSVEVMNKDGAWEALNVDGQRIDDQGYDVAVRMLSETPDEQGMSVYRAEWYNPLFAGPDQSYRFVIAPRDKQVTFYSPVFK